MKDLFMRGWVIALGGLLPFLAAGKFSNACEPDETQVAQRPYKIVLIAGPKSHGPVGNGIHDYPWSVRLLKVMLDHSNVADRVTVEYHLEGWPEDESTLDDADTILVISDGRDGELYAEAPHLASEHQIEMIQRQIDRGCGFMTFHFSTFAPDAHADRILDWTGGYFDWETEGRREWYSAITTLEAEVSPVSPEHPILNGIGSFRLREEFYYNLRFAADDAGVTPLWGVSALDGRDPDGRIVAWARERPHGGRGFGTTCGHFYDNWQVPEFRQLMLNAIFWTAGGEVPAEGVKSRYFTHAEIMAALDGVQGTEPSRRLEDPIRVLIVTGAQYPGHLWRDTTPAIQEALEQDSRMQVTVSEDIECLSGDLSDYDLLVFNYCNWQLPGLSEQSKQGFLDYLNTGRGVMFIHFANGAFHFSLPGAEDSDWPEYRNICRRVWDHTPGVSGHDAYGEFDVEIHDRDHDITRGMEDFRTLDELYFRQQGELPIHVLARARSQVTGEWEPMAFVYEYGKARVFQTVLGHAAESIRVPGTAELISRAAAWVARREQRPLRPRRPPPVPETSDSRPKTNHPGDRNLSVLVRRPPTDRPLKQTAEKPNHWGREIVGFDWTENDSRDSRWQEMEIGPVQASIVQLPVEPVAKGMTIRLGTGDEASICYDTATMQVRAAWSGGFLQFDPARYGLIVAPRPAGNPIFAQPPEAGWPGHTVQLIGHYRHGERIILSYKVDGVLIRESPSVVSAQLHNADSEPEDTVRSESEQSVPAEDGRPLTREEPVVVRTFEVAPRTTPLTLLAGPAAELQWFSQGADLQVFEQQMLVVIPPADETTIVHVVFSRSAGTDARDGADRDATSFFPDLDSVPPSLEPLLQGGPPLWGKQLETQGQISDDWEAPYVVDTLTLPFDNPWRALLFVGGHDFFSNGDAAICTVHGDVWRVSGLDETLERLVWTRMACGLFQPLGLRIVDDLVYVLGRDRITRLHDLNGDGEADFYECFYNGIQTSTGGHDYVTCLETDSAGNFYFLHALDGVVQVSSDGLRSQVIATGLRNPNGMSVGPGDVVTAAPQEGEWTPASFLCWIHPGDHYGYPGPQVTPQRPQGFDPPLCYFPRRMDNSSGGQVWVPLQGWGMRPGGELLHLSYGQCTLHSILVDQSTFHLESVPEGTPPRLQAGTVTWPIEFDSGAMRGRFHPLDGQLYVSGLRGWVTSAARDGSLQRVRATGRPDPLPIGVRSFANGLRLDFAVDLDPVLTQDAGRYRVDAWDYRYGAQYGSPDLLPGRDFGEGYAPVVVRSATLLTPRSLFLELVDLSPVDQLRVEMSIRTLAGNPIRLTYVHTLLRVPKEVFDEDRLIRPVDELAIDADLQERLSGGLITRFVPIDADRAGPFSSGGEPVDVRVSRLAACQVEVGETPSLLLPPGAFRLSMQGWLQVDLTDEYEFRLEGTGSLRVSFNGQPLLEHQGVLGTAAPVRTTLRQGWNSLTIEYASDRDGAGAFRVLWRGPGFAWEPLPPEKLWHDAADASLLRSALVREGRHLFLQLRCHRCHGDPSASILPAELALAGPDLQGISQRLHEDWLVRHLMEPATRGQQMTMPSLLDSDRSIALRDARDIVAYLATLPPTASGEPSHVDVPSASAELSSPVELSGLELYETLGCIACHRFNSPLLLDEFQRRSLLHVGQKFRPGELAAFLLQPARFHSATRMPDFRLHPIEAARLAEYLLSETARADKESHLAEGGDAARGRELFRQKNCAACHPLGSADVEAPLVLVDLQQRRATPVPCFQTERQPSAAEAAEVSQPIYHLDESQQVALRTFLEQAPRLHPEPGVEFVERVLSDYRCSACHDRDGNRAPRALLLAEEGETGWSPESFPTLTWTGERVHADWLQGFLSDRERPPLRPWLKGRMPHWSLPAETLAYGLAAQHGVSAHRLLTPLIRTPEQSDQQQEQIELGRQLTLPQALDCRQCHAMQGREPLGDERTLFARGLDFEVISRRTRHDFFQRYVLDPPRYDAAVRMPRLSADGRQTKVAEILEGDASLQFEAIWSFIQSLEVE